MQKMWNRRASASTERKWSKEILKSTSHRESRDEDAIRCDATCHFLHFVWMSRISQFHFICFRCHAHRRTIASHPVVTIRDHIEPFFRTHSACESRWLQHILEFYVLTMYEGSKKKGGKRKSKHRKGEEKTDKNDCCWVLILNWGLMRDIFRSFFFSLSFFHLYYLL